MQKLSTYFEEQKKNDLARLRASARYRSISEEEYAHLKLEQMQKLAQEEQASYQPDYALIGLREDEAQALTWEAVKPNVSDGMKALEAVKPAYERGWGMVFLWGTYGQAKTLIGKILVATAFRCGKRAAYANMSGVLDNIRLAFDEQEHKNTELVRRIRSEERRVGKECRL